LKKGIIFASFIITRYLVGNDAVAIMERRNNSSDSELEQWIKESLLEQKGFERE
jgi:hypothetical protein